jgi:hypothetical protein
MKLSVIPEQLIYSLYLFLHGYLWVRHHISEAWVIHDAIPGHSAPTQKQLTLRVECEEKARSKGEVVGEGGINHLELSIVLLEPDTALEGEILFEDAVDCRDLCFVVREKQTSIHPMVSVES